MELGPLARLITSCFLILYSFSTAQARFIESNNDLTGNTGVMQAQPGTGTTTGGTQAQPGTGTTTGGTQAQPGAGTTTGGTQAQPGAGTTTGGTQAQPGAGTTTGGTQAQPGAGTTTGGTQAQPGTGNTTGGTQAQPGAGTTAGGTQTQPGAGTTAGGTQTQPGTGTTAGGTQTQPGTGTTAGGTQTQPGTGTTTGGTQTQPGTGTTAGGTQAQPGTGNTAGGTQTQPGTGTTAGGTQTQPGAGTTAGGTQAQPGTGTTTGGTQTQPGTGTTAGGTQTQPGAGTTAGGTQTQPGAGTTAGGTQTQPGAGTTAGGTQAQPGTGNTTGGTQNIHSTEPNPKPKGGKAGGGTSSNKLQLFKNSSRDALPNDIKALQDDGTCLASLDADVDLKVDGQSSDLKKAFAQPGRHILTLSRKTNSDIKHEYNLTIFEKIKDINFGPDVQLVFEGKTKAFAEALILDGRKYSQLLANSDKSPIPPISWRVTDTNDAIIKGEIGANGNYFLGRLQSGSSNVERRIHATMLNSSVSICSIPSDNDPQGAADFLVLPNPGTFTVDPISVPLLPGQEVKLTAIAKYANGNAADDAIIDWQIIGQEGQTPEELKKFITIQPTIGRTVSIFGKFSPQDFNKFSFLQTPFIIRAFWRSPVPPASTENNQATESESTKDKTDKTPKKSSTNSKSPESSKSPTSDKMTRAQELSGVSVPADVVVTPSLVLDFRPIKVKLEPVDDKTAEKDYGRPMAKNYYVMRVRLTNNLKDENTGNYLGSSILVFSESMEMAVSLEKKYDKKLKSDAFKKQTLFECKKAVEAEHDKFDFEGRSYEYEDEPTCADSSDASDSGEVTASGDAQISKGISGADSTATRSGVLLSDKNTDTWTPVSIRRDLEGFVDINPEIFQYGARPAAAGKLEIFEPGDDAGEHICRSDFFYRPYSYEIVINTSDLLADTSRRAIAFKVANALGLLTSVVTSIAIPAKSSTLPLALDKYSNVFLPGVGKLWRDLSDSQRQNLVTNTMKPIEEIPFGSEISKIVFFPRNSFTGFVRGHKTRISQVCPYYFHATAAILNSNGATNGNTLINAQPKQK